MTDSERSRPMRARGLKPVATHAITPSGLVAPHAGAWIETSDRFSALRRASVAPHAGAWIETSSTFLIQFPSSVAPHAGAWIETPIRENPTPCRLSRPMRARGLKRAGTLPGIFIPVPSRPMRARGLKPRRTGQYQSVKKSRPMRARGLKLLCSAAFRLSM